MANNVTISLKTTPVTGREDEYQKLKAKLEQIYNSELNSLSELSDLFGQVVYIYTDEDPVFEENYLFIRFVSRDGMPYAGFHNLAEKYCVNYKFVFADENGDSDMYYSSLEFSATNSIKKARQVGMCGAENHTFILNEDGKLEHKVECFVPSCFEEYVMMFMGATDYSTFQLFNGFYNNLEFMVVDEDIDDKNFVYMGDFEGFFRYLEKKNANSSKLNKKAATKKKTTPGVLTVSEAKKFFKFDKEDENITITKYIGYDLEVLVPNMIGKAKVTSIGNDAFRGCKSLTSITIPDSVTTIGEDAFNGCESLTRITIPDSVTAISAAAFYGCISLEKIEVSEKNAVYDSRDNCNAIIETATNTLVCGCKESLIPDSVTSIGERAFYGCESLTSITIPNSVTAIERFAFGICKSLTSITIPDSVTTIGDFAFSQCISLTNVAIPDSVTTIGNDAFWVCKSLTRITIPNSVTTIGRSAFNECISLEKIEVSEKNAVYDSRDNCNAIIETATNTLIHGCKGTIIPDSVTAIGKDAFGLCRSLTSIIIPNSVTTIGESAFYGCESLTSITIPNSVTTIERGAFSCCDSLTSIAIPNGVKIFNHILFGCDSLTNITIPNSVTEIDNCAFWPIDPLKVTIRTNNKMVIRKLASKWYKILPIDE